VRNIREILHTHPEPELKDSRHIDLPPVFTRENSPPTHCILFIILSGVTLSPLGSGYPPYRDLVRRQEWSAFVEKREVSRLNWESKFDFSVAHKSSLVAVPTEMWMSGSAN
jgi:hypothetical protein